METGYDVCNNELLLRKLTQDPAPLSVPVFAQRFCVPHPQGVKFALISQNEQKIFPPCTFSSSVFTFPEKHFQRCTFYIKCLTHLIFSFNRNRLLSFITDESSVSCVKALLTRFQSRVGLPSFHSTKANPCLKLKLNYAHY